MGEVEKKKVPEASVPREEVAAAGQQAMEQIKRPTFNVKPDEAIFHDPSAETLRANQYRSGGWIHGPAQLELFVNTDRRLTKVANELGDPCTFVERVLVARIKGTKLLYIWPTDKEDADGIEVKRYASSAWINLITLLSPASMAVETGYKHRYEVNFAKPGDHVYPSLKLDLSRVLERRKESDSRSGASPDEIESSNETTTETWNATDE